MWNEIRNDDELLNFLKKVHYFHDSCIKEIKYLSGAYVEQDLAMYPINDQRLLNVIIQCQDSRCSVIEMEFSKLKTLKIGAAVTTIGDKAFYKCTALTKVTIPSKVSKIGKSAFYGCKKLKDITIKTTKLTSKKVGSKAFKGTPKKAKVKVPKKSLKAYKKFLVKKGISKNAKIK